MHRLNVVHNTPFTVRYGKHVSLRKFATDADRLLTVLADCCTYAGGQR
jgi:hypothetical protein